MLNAAIRRRDAAAVKVALATKQADAAALASASTLAAQAGDAAIAAMVKAAADATPAVPPKIIALNPSLLRSYEGNYQSASTGAVVKIAFDGSRLTLAAEGQPTLRLQPIEERRFIADDAPEINVLLGGRGGIIERMSIVRGTSTVRYEREGFGDATSAAPDPGGPPSLATRAAADPHGGPIRTRHALRRSTGRRSAAPMPRGVADGQGVVSDWDVVTGRNIKWKTAIPGLGTSSPIVWGNRVIRRRGGER